MIAPGSFRVGGRATPQEELASGWAPALERARRRGLPVPTGGGQLIRPLLGLAGAEAADEALWDALLAVQLAHEASLLHDDVIDGAARRRGLPTAVAAHGVAAALVEGDHLLTAGFRLAAESGSLAFARLYARAVERTVAGERLQNECRGEVLSPDRYRAIALGKSGELIGCAVAARSALAGDPLADGRFELGRRVGLCYQMLDDLLDYCAGADTGKTAFTDFRRRLWTWPLRHFPNGAWPADEHALELALREPDASGATPLEHAREELDFAIDAMRRDVADLLVRPSPVEALLDEWQGRARSAVRSTLVASAGRRLAPARRSTAPAAAVPSTASPILPALPDREELVRHFAHNSLSFSFAGRLLPRADRDIVTDLYAFCRATDEIVDGSTDDPATNGARLDAWLELCRSAYGGAATGVATLDRVLSTAAGRGVPFAYVELLVEGMRMDLHPRRYASLQELRTYTHAVAGVVGLWLARLWGVADPGVLALGAELGHAMQLTNIVRDVGEDLRRGRVYLPLDLMRRHGIDEAALARMASGDPITQGYRALLEALMEESDRAYERALRAVGHLPARVQPTVVAAAAVYRGIHDVVRANGYDSLRRRARTSASRKLALAAQAVVRLGLRPRLPVGSLTRAGALSALIALTAVAAPPAQAQPQAQVLAGPMEEQGLMAVAAGGADLHTLWSAALEDEAGMAALSRELTSIEPGSAHDEPLAQAYRGALLLLRAKHGDWPPNRLRDARAGLRALDSAVAMAPDHPEVRWLRLINGFNLPGWFGRGDLARTDLASLPGLLAAGRPRPSCAVHEEAARFLRERGDGAAPEPDGCSSSTSGQRPAPSRAPAPPGR